MLGFVLYLLVALPVAWIHHDTITFDGAPRPVTSATMGAIWPVVLLCVLAYLVVELCDVLRSLSKW